MSSICVRRANVKSSPISFRASEKKCLARPVTCETSLSKETLKSLATHYKGLIEARKNLQLHLEKDREKDTVPWCSSQDRPDDLTVMSVVKDCHNGTKLNNIIDSFAQLKSSQYSLVFLPPKYKRRKKPQKAIG